MRFRGALTPTLRAGLGFVGVSRPVFFDAQPMRLADGTTWTATLAEVSG